jgi:hypothetical protein
LEIRLKNAQTEQMRERRRSKTRYVWPMTTYESLNTKVNQSHRDNLDFGGHIDERGDARMNKVIATLINTLTQ